MQSDHYTLNWKEARFELLKKTNKPTTRIEPETFLISYHFTPLPHQFALIKTVPSPIHTQDVWRRKENTDRQTDKQDNGEKARAVQCSRSVAEADKHEKRESWFIEREDPRFFPE